MQYLQLGFGVLGRAAVRSLGLPEVGPTPLGRGPYHLQLRDQRLQDYEI